MPKLIVRGWDPLHWCIRLWWAKNASYKLMIASLLWSESTRLLNIPDINDVALVSEVIWLLWWGVKHVWNRTIRIDPHITWHTIPEKFWAVSRASAFFIGPLLAKFGTVTIPMPGGDKLGKRPLDRIMDGLESMWASRSMEGNMLTVSADKLVGTTYRFAKNSHSGTEILLMAAATAEGKTVLENAADEPEIDDMIALLNAMWAKIRRRSLRVIEIEWVEKLWWAIHSVIPDRNTAVTYACAALISKGDIIIENAKPEHMQAFLDKLLEAGGNYDVWNYGMRFRYDKPLRATDITTTPHPWFMTDRQALWALLMCTAEWDSTIHETIFPNRFHHYSEILEAMWAKFSTFDPQVTDPEKVYNFNREPDMVWWHYALKIQWPTQFTGWEFHLNDLRAWAAAILAWLIGSGETILHNIEQIYRWYERIDEKLRKMGANIELVE